MGLLVSHKGALITDSFWFNYAEWSHTTQWGYLSWHDVFYKSFIIYASISVLLVLHQLLHLVLTQLLTCDPETRSAIVCCDQIFINLAHRESVPLTQGCQNVPELSSHDRAVPLLVEHPQALHKILIRSAFLGLADVLVHGQELLEVEHFALHVWIKRWKRQGSPQRKSRLSIMSSPHNPGNVGERARSPPSALGFPRTCMISDWVGFWPKALIRSPHWP